MNKISRELLKSVGLTETQGAVYLSALELGEANMQDLARKSGVKRTSIYNFIDELKARGFLVETTKRKRKIYSAADPQQLLEVEKTRLAELERLMPELLAAHNKPKNKPRVRFYENIEGIKEVYADMLKDKKEILAFEDLEHMKAALPKSFYDWFPPERARRGIPFKSILRDSAEARQLTQKNIGLLRQSKLLNTADWKTEINLYGDKTALMSFRAKTPFCVMIEDRDITETLRTAWRELWNRLGPDAIG
jgi:sugar-specific transcriptional regulator TrmB